MLLYTLLIGKPAFAVTVPQEAALTHLSQASRLALADVAAARRRASSRHLPEAEGVRLPRSPIDNVTVLGVELT